MEWEARVAAAGRRLWTFSYEFDTVRCQRLSGSNSVVECQLPKLDVAGSTPVSRSNIIKHLAPPNPICAPCTPFVLR